MTRMKASRIYKRAVSSFEKIADTQSKFNIFISTRSTDHLKSELNKVLTSDSSLALKGTLSAMKDNIATTNEFTTCGSKMLSSYKSPFNATVVQLLEDAGSVVVGKTNLDEFGMGSGNTFSFYGPVLNPVYPEEAHISGGSSGGSAAAVAADLCDFALGTDTGGSVRLPAAYCNILGFKGSYGRISRWGIVAYAQSLDTVGILSKNIETLEDVFEVLDKYDEKDPTSMTRETREKIESVEYRGHKKLTIGIPMEYHIKELTSFVKVPWLESLKKLQDAGHIVKPISIPTVTKSLPIYYTIAPAEAASNLSRYDGVRYGYRSDKDTDEHGVLYGQTRSEGFGEEVQRRIILGNYTLSSDTLSNHFLVAQKCRSQLKLEFDEVFAFPNVGTSSNIARKPEGVDIIITPSTMSSAPTLTDFNSKHEENFLSSYINDFFTVPASLAGIPAISIPWASKNSNIHPSLQIMGQFGDDKTVLEAAKILMNLNKQ